MLNPLRLVLVIVGFLWAIAVNGEASAVVSPLDKPLNTSVKPIVVVSIKPLALMVQGLAGDDFIVRTLGSGSSDPHAQAMTIADRTAIANASLVVWLGPRFERFLAKTMQSAPQSQLQLGVLLGLQWPGEPQMDLHLWLNPDNDVIVYKALAQRLGELSPPHAELIHSRLTKRLGELSEAKAHIIAQLMPYKNAPFAVSHDGFGHYVQAFGLNQRAAATRLPEEQLSAKRMLELHKLLMDARCLLIEPHDHHGHKLANSIGLPEVAVDALGRNNHILSLTDLLHSVTQSLLTCFAEHSDDERPHENH